MKRAAFTMAEMMVSLAVVLVVMVLVVQTVGFSAAERMRAAARRSALAVAENQLEAARAVPFAELTDAWAKARTLPSDVTLPADAVLSVRVETDAKLAPVRRVTVTIRWEDVGDPASSVELVGLVGPREHSTRELKR